VETLPVAVSRDQAVSVALIVNELVTNAFRHGKPPCRVHLHDDTKEGFRLTVSDGGQGPPENPKSGLGARIITSISRQLDATLERHADETGYRCTLFVPRQSATPTVAEPQADTAADISEAGREPGAAIFARLAAESGSDTDLEAIVRENRKIGPRPDL
jgi:signal transduction histidine kinase